MKFSLLGRLRRLIHPTLKFWLLRSSASKTVRIAGLTLHVFPTVFHPRYFGSSSILGDYLSGLELARLRVLDMGTGSGVIGLRAARAGALVTALDINPAAVACAKENARVNGLAIEVLESDLFVAVEGRKFDLIAWNPPFFPREARDVAEHALHAGDDFCTISRFACSARSHLAAGGAALLVLSTDIEVAGIEGLFADQGFVVARVDTRRWGFGETMIVLEIR